jgi:hypothetical protein
VGLLPYTQYRNTLRSLFSWLLMDDLSANTHMQLHIYHT